MPSRISRFFLQLSRSIENRTGLPSRILTQLRKAACAAEDLLDELDYEDLKLKVTTSRVGIKLRKNIFAHPSPLHLPQQPHSSSNERILIMMEDLNRISTLIKLAYPLVMHTTGGENDEGLAMVITGTRVATSTINTIKIYGRDEKKKEIINTLQIEARRLYSIIGIVGVGGVGKTTLAQYVFNDQNLITLFDFKVWISVSDEYIKEKIIKEIIMDTASYKKDTSIILQSITSMDTLERMLIKNVENKRLLLVLDDVWSNQWVEILLSLQKTVRILHIIVTTREARNMMLPVEFSYFENKILELEGLDDEEYRRLFEQHTFGIQGPSNHPKGPMLQPIGWQIAEKLKGSPLAAKTVGAVLRERLDVDHWRRVQVAICGEYEIRSQVT